LRIERKWRGNGEEMENQQDGEKSEVEEERDEADEV